MHRKGIHCGSTAMGDALRAHGLDLPEEQVFGLGAGLGFSLHNGDPSLSPPQATRFFVGRSATFERDLCELIGADLQQEYFANSADAMANIDGKLVYTDLFELPYLGAHGHWFGHLIVVQDEHTVWDNEFEQAQHVERLEKALCTETPTRTVPGAIVLHVESAPPAIERDAPQKAVYLQSLRMTESMEDVEQLAREIDSWRDAGDWPRRARLAAQVIELRGCGGGLFRRMYSRFLETALPELAQPCVEAANAWSELAQKLDQPSASQCAKKEGALWTRALEILQ
jgi:hypothetical protein